MEDSYPRGPRPSVAMDLGQISRVLSQVIRHDSTSQVVTSAGNRKWDKFNRHATHRQRIDGSLSDPYYTVSHKRDPDIINCNF